MIQHKIELTASGYRLEIWEPAPKTTSRVSPFIFKATYMLSSHSEALEILNMVKGEKETIFSKAKHKAIDDQRNQDFRQPALNRQPVVALQV